MTDFLNRNTVLRLNALYQVLGVANPAEALVAMNSNSSGRVSARAINVVYGFKDDGSIDFEDNWWEPVEFEEWLSVPIRDGLDHAVHTSRLTLRSPTVIITSYDQIPKKRLRPTKSVLYELQRGVCGITGKKISMKQANIEHKIPRSYGGKETFENLMVADKKANSDRGNKPYSELGIRPLFRHREPAPIPSHYTIKNVGHPDWLIFLPK